MRQAGNGVERILRVFAARRVGWFDCGLVVDRTQLDIQEAQYRSEKDSDLWQQNVLQEDGTPYREKEVELIQGFRYLESPNQ